MCRPKLRDKDYELLRELLEFEPRPPHRINWNIDRKSFLACGLADGADLLAAERASYRLEHAGLLQRELVIEHDTCIETYRDPPDFLLPFSPLQERRVSYSFTPKSDYGSNGGCCHVVITDDGLRVLEQFQQVTTKPPKPSFDPNLRRLLYEGRLVKVFRQKAPHQEIVLRAFEEEGWPRRIDDPLPDGKVKHTVRNLNANQKDARVFFVQDGTNEGITWSVPDHDDPPR